MRAWASKHIILHTINAEWYYLYSGHVKEDDNVSGLIKWARQNTLSENANKTLVWNEYGIILFLLLMSFTDYRKIKMSHENSIRRVIIVIYFSSFSILIQSKVKFKWSNLSADIYPSSKYTHPYSTGYWVAPHTYPPRQLHLQLLQQPGLITVNLQQPSYTQGHCSNSYKWNSLHLY